MPGHHGHGIRHLADGAGSSAVTFDLKGHTLMTTGADWQAGGGVAPRSGLTITDSSSPSTDKLIADGGQNSTGIGGSSDSSGDIAISGQPLAHSLQS